MDRKRVYGPEESVKPIMACNENTNAFDRTNERDLDQIRSIFAKHGIIPQASGSVFFESGKTKIFAAVYGPRAVTKGKESFETGQICCEFKYACFATAKRATYAPVPNFIYFIEPERNRIRHFNTASTGVYSTD